MKNFTVLTLILLFALLLSACGTLSDPCAGRADSTECRMHSSQLQATLEQSDRNRVAQATEQAHNSIMSATNEAAERERAAALANAGSTATIEAAQSQAAINQANAQATIVQAQIDLNRSNSDATATAVANENTLNLNRVAASATSQALTDRASIEREENSARIETAKFQTTVDLVAKLALGTIALVAGLWIGIKILLAVATILHTRSQIIVDGNGNIYFLTTSVKDGQPERIVNPRLLLQPSTSLSGADVIDADRAERVKLRDQNAVVYEVMAKNRVDVFDEADSALSDTRAQPGIQTVEHEQLALPAAPRFSELLRDGYRPTRERMIISYDKDGPVYGALVDQLSVAIAGRQGVGKTTYLRYVVANAIMIGARVVLWDPHSDVMDQIKSPAITALFKSQDIRESAAEVLAELERRIDRGLRLETPILVLSDEVNSLIGAVPEVRDPIKKMVYEGRKYSVFCMLSTKGMPASLLGDSTVRDAFAGHVAFQTSRRAATMLGMDPEALDEYPPYKLPKTYALSDIGGTPRLIQVPRTEAEDIKALLPASEAAFTASGPRNGSGGEVVQEVDGEAVVVDAEKRETVRQLLARGVPQSKIIEQVWGVKSGGGSGYQKAATEMSKIIATLV